ncbi:WXG100 family type VII secretion target [Streptomyces tsukubensis]|uniref:WXG100 family type VII secretion target n=1 Tax=Streptomyces tsukubensis TaxID=83656 RepID=A0A1V4A4X9_9ACTN|nr:WXG100 family type VII secretion target [Streptomyces tsukubensis]OON76171.1 hypothetical protein B1H18_21325 [Streptomyces tsukubensis]QFR93697.1 hypothetical protein GBW32_12140 [Streptomyces tsukubensis]
MAVQNNYDASQIRVDPWVLNSSAASIATATKTIAAQLQLVMKHLDMLYLSWVGDDPDSSPALAADFTNRWSAAMITLYGDGTDADRGIFGDLIDGINAAALNYSTTESTITGVFKTFHDSFVVPEGATSAMLNSLSELPVPTVSADGVVQFTPPPSPVPVDHVDNPSPPFHETSVNETF